MPPRIVTISDHVDCPTGFGVQHRHLAAALARAGFDVHSLGLWDTRPLGPTPEGAARYPGGLGPHDHRRAWPMYRELLRPDLVITLGDLESFAHLNDAPARPFAWCHWLPLDALPYPSRHHERLLRYDRLVLMSRFALELVRPHLEGHVPLHYIPHGVDPRVFRPHEDPPALRQRWGRRLGLELRPDDFVLIARDANQWRKQPPVLLDALARLPRDVKLLFHCHPVAHPAANGWDLVHLARDVYGVGDRVAFTSGPGAAPHAALAPEELAELDSLADLRVSATAGEGFGVVTLEAMACGTPTLITDYTTSRELLLGRLEPRDTAAPVGVSWAGALPPADGGGEDAGHGGPAHIPDTAALGGADGATAPPLRTPHSALRTELDPFGPAGELVRVAAWTLEPRRHLFRPVPDAADLAARVLALRADPARRARYGVAGLRRALAHYTIERVARDWVALARQALAE